MASSQTLRRAIPVLAFVAGVLIALGVGFAALHRDRADEPAAAAPANPPTPPPSQATPAPAEPAPVATSESHPVAAGATLQLDRAAFPKSGPVRVSLGLPETSADAEPRPVRVVSQPDHRILELPGALDSGRTAATIEMDADYLQPGTYLVEVQTTERSHFPLRRYFIIVR
jgi:hypothetical protein